MLNSFAVFVDEESRHLDGHKSAAVSFIPHNMSAKRYILRIPITLSKTHACSSMSMVRFLWHYPDGPDALCYEVRTPCAS
jgi:hypothetical protein